MPFYSDQADGVDDDHEFGIPRYGPPTSDSSVAERAGLLSWRSVKQAQRYMIRTVRDLPPVIEFYSPLDAWELFALFEGIRGEPFDDFAEGSPSPSESASNFGRPSRNLPFQDSSDENTILGQPPSHKSIMEIPSPSQLLLLAIDSPVSG